MQMKTSAIKKRIKRLKRFLTKKYCDARGCITPKTDRSWAFCYVHTQRWRAGYALDLKEKK